MASEITVPDIGDFESVEIIEILAKSGDIIKKNDPIVTLESDKSSVEVPSPFSGKISSMKVKIGDKVSKGSVLALIENEEKKIDKVVNEKKENFKPLETKVKSENKEPIALKKKDILPETEEIIKEAESAISQQVNEEVVKKRGSCKKSICKT